MKAETGLAKNKGGTFSIKQASAKASWSFSAGEIATNEADEVNEGE